MTTLAFTNNGMAVPAESHAGHHIAYVRIGRQAGEPLDSTGIHLVYNGTDSPLRDNSGSVILGDYPQWSYGDSLIAFTTYNAVKYVQLSTGIVTTLASATGNHAFAFPRWLQGNAYILVAESRVPYRTLFIRIADGVTQAWPYYLGGNIAISPDDTSFAVAAAQQSGHPPLPMVIFTRQIQDYSGSSTRQLTSVATATGPVVAP